MIISNYITPDLKALSFKNTFGEAVKIMASLKISHIPILKKKELLGNLSYNNAKEEDPKGNIEDYLLEEFSIFEKATLLDSFRVFSNFESNIIPVVTIKGTYLGSVLAQDVMEEISTFPFITEPGLFLTIETSVRNYSISQIANIIESNNAKFFGSMITFMNEEQIQITLKISSMNIISIQETFERFDYLIVDKLFEDSREEFFKDRFKHLKNFMEL